jgi:hypothetical protein
VPGTGSGPALQDEYAAQSICFGCGPANEQGLRIKSRRFERGLRTVFEPAPEHQAFSGIVCGGILGTLIDCHGNWTAAVALMDRDGTSELPSTVTARYEVTLRRPTPAGTAIVITSEVAELLPDRATVNVACAVDGVVTATGSGTFVAVSEGHPAYHRWT